MGELVDPATGPLKVGILDIELGTPFHAVGFAHQPQRHLDPCRNLVHFDSGLEHSELNRLF